MMFMHTVFHNFTVNIHFLLFMVNQIAVTNIAAWTKQETEHTVPDNNVGDWGNHKLNYHII